jgi:uracil-DNA glycosylase
MNAATDQRHMPSTNEIEYAALVESRRACTVCQGLQNPSVVCDGAFDSAEIGPWSRWQGRLDAPIMVVGQDFSDAAYFERWKGVDQPDNPTNRNLCKLLRSVGIDITDVAGQGDRGQAFFTNAILCLKSDRMQGKVHASWFANCGPRFLRPQIEIVRPRVVVGLGNRAFNAVLAAFQLSAQRLRDAVVSPGTLLFPGTVAVAVYHCGARVTNISRPLSIQMADWQRVRVALHSSAV